MKMKRIKPLIPFLLFLLCGASRGPVRYVITPSMEVGPYSKYQSNPTISYKIVSTYLVDKTIYEIFRFGDTNNPSQRTVTKATHTVTAQGTYVGAITLPTSTFLGDSGMSITIEIYNGDGSINRAKTFVIYPTKNEIIDPTTYNGTYTCPQTHMVMTSSIVKYTNETYSFPKVDDYFLTDTYYRLPIEQFVIQTSLTAEEFSYLQAYIKIEGMDQYFPSMVYLNGYTLIPLTVNYSGGLLTLSLKNSLYVEPKLLFMSNLVREGYVATNNFYLPVNHARDLVGASFTIEITKVGYSKTTFSWRSSLLAESPLVGDCQNSSYCVVGSVTK